MHYFPDDSSLFTCVGGVEQTQDTLIKDLQTSEKWCLIWM